VVTGSRLDYRHAFPGLATLVGLALDNHARRRRVSLGGVLWLAAIRHANGGLGVVIGGNPGRRSGHFFYFFGRIRDQGVDQARKADNEATLDTTQIVTGLIAAFVAGLGTWLTFFSQTKKDRATEQVENTRLQEEIRQDFLQWAREEFSGLRQELEIERSARRELARELDTEREARRELARELETEREARRELAILFNQMQEENDRLRQDNMALLEDLTTR
jgi:hypothetical protein